MTMQSYQHHHKVRVVIECSSVERARLKMRAAQKHMTLSQYVLDVTKEDIRELEESDSHSFESLDDFWKQMGIDPYA